MSFELVVRWSDNQETVDSNRDTKSKKKKKRTYICSPNNCAPTGFVSSYIHMQFDLVDHMQFDLVDLYMV